VLVDVVANSHDQFLDIAEDTAAEALNVSSVGRWDRERSATAESVALDLRFQPEVVFQGEVVELNPVGETNDFAALLPGDFVFGPVSFQLQGMAVVLIAIVFNNGDDAAIW
jgi:hypothetical protein